MRSRFDHVIVGAGPAGLAIGIELLRHRAGRVAVLEKGMALSARFCPAIRSGICVKCRDCSVLSGVGGASGLLGGKLCYFPAGQRLADHIGSSSEAANLTVQAWLGSLYPGCKPLKIHTPAKQDIEFGPLSLKQYCSIPIPQAAMNRLFELMVFEFIRLGGIIDHECAAIDVRPRHDVGGFDVIGNRSGVRHEYNVSQTLTLATGRAGVRWLHRIFRRLNIPFGSESVDVGVRLDVASSSTSKFLTMLQDPKLKLHAGSDREVRTLCWCRDGVTGRSNIYGLQLADGHFANEPTGRTSVSIVARLPVPPMIEPLKLAADQFSRTMRDSGALWQSIRQFLILKAKGSSGSGTRMSNWPCSEGNIRGAMNRDLSSALIELLEELDSSAEGSLVNDPSGVIYGPVIDKFWGKPIISKNLMTPLSSLYLAGDASGLARGVIQAIYSGLIVAGHICTSHSRENRSLVTAGHTHV